VAFNGAEPVRPATLKRFSQAFKSCGFKEESFYPCYGTAESTLIISGAHEYSLPAYLNVNRELYEKGIISISEDVLSNNSVSLVASGKELITNSIAIIDPETNSPLDDCKVGEIWLTSPCNALGYWNNPEASFQAFGNKIDGDLSDRKYLNTGDLGFLYKGHIYITGRSKDLLIFNGRNIYPQDIEACSEASHPALKSGRSAAVSLYIDGKERLILIHEVERVFARKIPSEEVIEKIRVVVNREFSLPVYAVALVSPSTIPMTSSGKIRRQSCREQYKNNELEKVAHWSEVVSGNNQIKSEVSVA